MCNEQAVFEKVQDNDSTKNAIFESNISPFTHESIMLFYFVTIYKPSSDGSNFIWQKINVLNIQYSCAFLFFSLHSKRTRSCGLSLVSLCNFCTDPKLRPILVSCSPEKKCCIWLFTQGPFNIKFNQFSQQVLPHLMSLNIEGAR